MHQEQNVQYQQSQCGAMKSHIKTKPIFHTSKQWNIICEQYLESQSSAEDAA